MRPKKVILCVDDNETALSVRTFLLETRGYRVINATTAQEALEILEKTVPGTLDLLIADLLLPGMDGNELVRRAKQMHPMLPALIVSGTVASFDRALAADAFLPKGGGHSGGAAREGSRPGRAQTRSEEACADHDAGNARARRFAAGRAGGDGASAPHCELINAAA